MRLNSKALNMLTLCYVLCQSRSQHHECDHLQLIKQTIKQ